MTQLVALLSWFAEQPDFLHDCILSLPKAGVTYLIGVDGGYQLFPGTKRRSSQEERDAIREAALEADIGLEVHTPAAPWSSEMAKRNFLFRKAEKRTSPEDWLLVIDGDERILEADTDGLAEVEEEVAAITLVEPHPDLQTTRSPTRRLYRANRGIHLKGNHYTYCLPDGRILWGQDERVPALDLRDAFSLEHRTHFRSEKRRSASRSYYSNRERQRQESSPCGVCGGRSVAQAPWDWQVHPAGLRDGNMGRLTSRWMWACERHRKELEQEARQVAIKYGLDPDQLRCQRQNV